MTPGRWLAPVLLALPGCAEVLDIPEDPAVVAPGPWHCLEQPALPPIPAASTATVQVAACDLLSNCATPVTGLRARLCERADATCDSPLATDIVDSSGLLSFTVPTPADGFAGYLQIDSATELCTNPSLGDFGPALCALAPGCDPAAPDDACRVPLYARSLLFFDPPVFNDTTQPISLPLVPSTGMSTLAAAAHAGGLDLSTGSLFVTALDCDGRRAAGVSYRIDRDQDRVTPLYLVNAAASDAALETDDSGLGGFWGVPPGVINVTGNDPDSHPVGALAAFTAALTVSYGFLAPPLAASP